MIDESFVHTWREKLEIEYHIQFTCLEDIKLLQNIRIIPLWTDHTRAIFQTKHDIFRLQSLESQHILQNKVRFVHFMMTQEWQRFLPVTVFYHYKDLYFHNKQIDTTDPFVIITKPPENSGGYGIKVKTFHENDLTQNILIQKYIPHTRQYTAHFRVHDGIIHERHYFYSEKPSEVHIQKGANPNFTVHRLPHDENIMPVDDYIFDLIFFRLGYSGFANADFIVHNGQCILFEINPRCGASLFLHESLFPNMIHRLIEWDKKNDALCTQNYSDKCNRRRK